jgi:hypothetical protein
MHRLSVLVLVAVLLAACGGSGRMSKAQYEQSLQTDGKALQQAVTALTGSTSITSLAQLATQVDAAEAAVKKAADDLASVKAPKDAVADNTAIVAALRAIQTGLENVKKTATSGNAAAVQKAAASIETLPQLKAAEKAVGDLKAKGYKVGVLGS